MIIEDKITEFMQKHKRINENIIYLSDIHFNIVKLVKLKKGDVKRKRIAILTDELFQKNPGIDMTEYNFNKYVEKLKITEKETFEVSKVVLKKEISCSFYKR